MKCVLRLVLPLYLLIATSATAGQLEDQLFKAAQTGDTAAVQSLLAKGANINARDAKNSTVLKTAAMYGKTDVVRLLIAKGVAIDAKDDYGATALMVSGNTDIARILIESGADVNAKTGTGLTALMLAAAAADMDMCKLLAGKGADVNAKERGEGTTVLMYAIGKKLGGSDEWNPKAAKVIAQLLLDNGAAVNAKDKKGRTALMWAVGGEITTLLIARGADVSADSFGVTALSLARWANDTEKIHLLEQAERSDLTTK